jgi:hypothetical protein
MNNRDENSLASMTEAELVAARDETHAAAGERPLEWPEFAKRMREWLLHRDECDRRGIPRR